MSTVSFHGIFKMPDASVVKSGWPARPCCIIVVSSLLVVLDDDVVVVLKKAAMSEEDMPSSYLLHMRARSSGVVFPLPEVSGMINSLNDARRANHH